MAAKLRGSSALGGGGYDVIHFEALGPEAAHLRSETAAAVRRGELPRGLRCLLTPDAAQEYLRKNPRAELPALVTIKTHSSLPDGYFAGARKSVITRSAGYDHVEDRARQANVASLREYCVDAVAQTAMKMLYAAAGRLNHYAQQTATFDRRGAQAFMELGRHRTLTVFGVGKIGSRICELAEANGLAVQGVDLRARELRGRYGGRVAFVSKARALAASDVIVNAMNLTRDPRSRFYNAGYFSRAALSGVRRGCIFINVTRGEIAPEPGLLSLYRAGRLGGLGLDVFSNEAAFARLLAGEAAAGRALLAARELVRLSLSREGNVYVQPHQGFNSDLAAKAKAVEAVRHVTAWFRNGGARFDEQLPYY